VRAALLVEPGRIELGDVPSPVPGAGEVRIAIVGVGLCGSDLSVFSGAWDAPEYPWVMGHEAFGMIDAVGTGVPSTRLGQTVVVEPNIVCGACGPCRRGRTSACAQRRSVGMNRPGCLADHVVVPTQHAWQVTTGSAEDLVCVEPMTVVETALRRLRVPVPQSALIVGVGAQGSLMCLALQRRGTEVVVADVNPERTAFAVGLGAAAIGDVAVERRFDLVVDTAGSPPAVEVALARAEVGGTII
jgi:threonine dehydrogenase-like Zn-dependent dehydrogenase